MKLNSNSLDALRLNMKAIVLFYVNNIMNIIVIMRILMIPSKLTATAKCMCISQGGMSTCTIDSAQKRSDSKRQKWKSCYQQDAAVRTLISDEISVKFQGIRQHASRAIIIIIKQKKTVRKSVESRRKTPPSTTLD